MRKCRWSCGRITKNISRICYQCSAAAEQSRAPTDDGYKAWLESKRAKATKAPKLRSSKQQAHIEKVNTLRVAELATNLRVTELSDC